MIDRRVDEMDDSQMEKLLDRALASYSAAEPLAGLEQRVLDRARGVQPKARVLGWGWSWAGVAACLVIGISVGVVMERRQSPKAVLQLRASFAHSFTDKTASLQAPVAEVRRPRAVRHHRIEPERPSREELLLLEFVAQQPEEAAQAFDSLHRSLQSELKVDALSVEPLSVNNLQ